jgi:hypothetical protein
MSFAQAGSVGSHLPVGTPTYDHKVIEETVLPDGRVQIWTFISTGAVFKFVFNKDETWKNETLEFWLNDELSSGPVRPSISELSMDTIKNKFKKYAVNRTTWKKIGKHTVPVETIISSQTRFRNEEFEIRYMDWRFKEDADLSLLEEENFTLEAIPKSLSFPKLREQLDQYASDTK